MTLISVVIPTRNRLSYLRDALQSALDHRSPDIEIIVADNATDDGTKEYLASLGDAIKVTRSDELLPMSDNWDRALKVVTGEWVIFVGDDDCLMPDFAVAARKAIAEHPTTELIFWDTPIYRWPSSINERERNFLTFTLRSGFKIASSKETLRRMYEEIVSIMAPPGLYHGLSKTSLIQKAKDKWGEYRLGKVPDLSSGLLSLALTETFVLLDRPLSVMAFGSQSTGMAYKNAKNDFGPRAEFARLSRMEDLAEKYPLVDIDNVNVHHWRLLLDWQDYFRARGVQVTLNNSKMLHYCIMRLNAIPKEDRQEAATKFTEYSVNLGVPREQIEALVKQGLALDYGFKPSQSVHKDGDVTVLRLGADLSKTPIKTATGAAGLIYGYLSR